MSSAERGRDRASFSALQRAENSSIRRATTYVTTAIGFSALQRAENSSIVWLTAVAGDD